MYRIFVVFLSLLLLPTVSQSTPYYKLFVKIQGLTPMATPLVGISLSIKAAEKEKKINEDRIESLHQIAPTEITTTLEALGYYHSNIQSELNQTPEGFFASYYVTMGRPTLIRKVTVKITGEGARAPELKRLADSPPLQSGMQLTHNSYETYKQALLGKALQLGFLDAVFSQNEIQINPDQYGAEIILVLNSGRQYTFGEVNFQKNPYPDAYLRRYIPFTPGEPYTTHKILTFQKALMDTDLFRYARIDPALNESQDNCVPLNVRLKPKPKNRYTGSIGYGTDSKARAMFWWEHRRESYPGHRINGEIRASQRKNYGNLRYTIPGRNPATDRSVFAFRVIEEKFPDGKYSLRQDLSANQMKKIGKFERLVGLHYLINERYREIPIEPKKNAHFVIPNIGLSFTDILKKSPSEEGFRMSATCRGALGKLFSTTSFAQADIRGKWVYSLGPSTRILMRGEFGTTATPRFNKIPISLRYFTGGDQTVRGYGYKSLGPQRFYPFGNKILEVVVGGRYMAVGSLELEQKVYKQFSGAVFFDIGQAMDSWRTSFGRSVGVGVRYATPLGPLRIDVAQPLRVYTQRKARPRIHLTFGMDL